MPQRKKQPGQQAKKFIDAAREAGASDDEADFDRALGKIAKAPPPKSIQKRKVQHASDCATHNGPAYEAGPCDCGAENAED